MLKLSQLGGTQPRPSCPTRPAEVAGLLHWLVFLLSILLAMVKLFIETG